MPPPSRRATVRHRPQRASYDLQLVRDVLDQAWVCHVGVIVDGGPTVIPMTQVRIDDSVVLHGAALNRVFQRLRQGAEACVEATIIDGLVLGGSPMTHSLNYRSVIAYGRLDALSARAEKERAAAALLDRLAPGRRKRMRPLTSAELEATSFYSMKLDEASVKARRGMPDAVSDGDAVWSGVIPLATTALAPQPANGVKTLGSDPLPAPPRADALPGLATGPGRPSRKD